MMCYILIPHIVTQPAHGAMNIRRPQTTDLLPYNKLYRYVPPQRVWFFSYFGLKTGIDFDHYGLKSGMVFKGTTEAYKRICLFNSK